MTRPDKPTTWRLIYSPPASGAWNMAVDEAILDCVRLDEVPATLRLYAWEPACLSLGYAQSIKDVDQVALSANGWNLVRRPTGGRAILHTDELTYAVIGPPEDPRLAGSVLESYRCLSQALLEALTRLKITVEAHEKPELASRNQAETANPVCFEVPSNYEITFLGKKLVGSAQARRRDGVLQHGSLPLWGDLTRILQVLVFKYDNEREEAARRLLSRAVTAEGALGVPVSWDQAAAAFVNGFENALNLRFQPGELTQTEVARAQVLVDEKYAHPRWTERI